MTDILNCPCCEGKAEFIKSVSIRGPQRLARLIRIGFIACTKCGLQTRVSSQGRVLKTWNRRPVKAEVQP